MGLCNVEDHGIVPSCHQVQVLPNSFFKSFPATPGRKEDKKNAASVRLEKSSKSVTHASLCSGRSADVGTWCHNQPGIVQQDCASALDASRSTQQSLDGQWDSRAGKNDVESSWEYHVDHATPNHQSFQKLVSYAPTTERCLSSSPFPATDFSTESNLSSSSPGIKSCNGQSLSEPPESEAAIPDDAPDISMAIHEQQALSNRSLLVRSDLKAQLRPSQRLQKPERLLGRTQDRFVPARPPLVNIKDVLLIGQPARLSPEQTTARSSLNELTDPFGPGVSRRRLITTGRPSTTEHLSRSNFATPLDFLQSRQGFVLGVDDLSIGSNFWMSGDAGINSRRPMETIRRQASRSDIPTFSSDFLESPRNDSTLYEDRLALALGHDRLKRIIEARPSPTIRTTPSLSYAISERRTNQPAIWNDNAWMRQMHTLLDAPNLRDDFYCSVLAYSHTTHKLAVGLGSHVHFWSERLGVTEAPKEVNLSGRRSEHITSLAFSSEHGGRAILAVARADRSLVLYSPLDLESRILRMMLPNMPTHISFRPIMTKRISQREVRCVADNEMLLVGDETGMVSTYFVDWPQHKDRYLFGWHGSVTLHTRIVTHTQQICGIAWSPDGAWFATGGNDNLCCLFQTKRLLQLEEQRRPLAAIRVRSDTCSNTFLDMSSLSDTAISFSHVKHYWRINAAVKAIAFCPWQNGLLAVGGGSNDRRIHFFHTISGACLARIDCAAQVTSLVWSKTRREIAATLGFPQPDHPFRIAVYSWPNCEQVTAISWPNEGRALYAIRYPGGPDRGRTGREGGSWSPRTQEEGCIAVAASDKTVRFHEVWCDTKQGVRPRYGSFCDSDILEGLHDIEKDSIETIR